MVICSFFLHNTTQNTAGRMILKYKTIGIYFDVLLTLYLSIFTSVINQLDEQKFCSSSWLITEINLDT